MRLTVRVFFFLLVVANAACSDGTNGACQTVDAGNPPGCPAVYTHQGGACSPVGLSCVYPGQGDYGCSSNASLYCTDAGTWRAFQ